jgi:hypothetical protein
MYVYTHYTVIILPLNLISGFHRASLLSVTFISTFEPLYVISVKYRLSLPDDGCDPKHRVIFNVCLLDFCITRF